MRIVGAILCAFVLVAPVADRHVLAADSCDALERLTLPDTTINRVELVEAGSFTSPGPAAPDVFKAVPSFCRALVTIKPSADSDVRAEVWMPSSGWNGKFEAVGNGGLGGSIPYPALASAITAGYAAAATDTGHVGANADFVQHPERFTDFGYRSIHEMTLKAKSILAAYYNSGPSRSYFNACSTGGRQGLTEAQRYPEDFDGIVAGASAWDQMRLYAARIALNLTVNKDPSSIIAPAKYGLMNDAVLKSCDSLDGVKDGLIEDPRRCGFNYATLACKGADGSNCLTRGQVESARAMTSPVKDPKSGRVLLEGHLWPGSELGWNRIGGPEPCAECLEGLRKIVFRNPEWDYHTMRAASDVDRAVSADGGLLYSGDPNLAPFFARGGKLLMYHGWSDPTVTPQMSITYYSSVIRAVGRPAANSITLFMVPGMGHCQGGPGTDTFDKVGALDRWVESGQPPASIVAAHMTNGVVDRTRPLCPFPQVAVYNKRGSPDEAANFTCKKP